MKLCKCALCGQMAVVIKESKCPVVCCGQPMEVLEPGTTDGAREKHIPVWEAADGVVNVTVGSVEHPMLPAHYIEWIALESKKTVQLSRLEPGAAPKASFALTEDDEPVAAYEFCNLHGFWKG